MSWILQNKFIAALLAGTLVLSGLLIYLGSMASARYQDRISAFQEASAQVASYERLALYPNQENLDGKAKAIAEYEEAIHGLIAQFEKFQPESAERISPQDFTTALIAAHQQITSGFDAANVALPDGFYSGFEDYTGALAQSGATAVLTRQLEMVTAIMGDLTRAKPAEINNFLRERQPEETGTAYEPKPDQITRPHSFELTFHGTEESARKFLTSLMDTNSRFVVIRTLRVTNDHTSAPKSSAAQFATSPTGRAEAGNNPFAGLFPTLDDDEEASEAADDVLAPPAPQSVTQAVGGTRMLAQVAGSEMVRVFIRFDVMEFLPNQASANSSDES